jgi:hypothetical protein
VPKRSAAKNRLKSGPTTVYILPRLAYSFFHHPAPIRNPPIWAPWGSF